VKSPVAVEKTLFRTFQQTKFACRLLNVSSPQALKFSEITALVSFRHPQLFTVQSAEQKEKKRVKEQNWEVQKY